jgi:hypothetical protein
MDAMPAQVFSELRDYLGEYELDELLTPVELGVKCEGLGVILRVDESSHPCIHDEDGCVRRYGHVEVAVRHFVRMVKAGYRTFDASIEAPPSDHPDRHPEDSCTEFRLQLVDIRSRRLGIEVNDSTPLRDFIRPLPGTSPEASERFSILAVDHARISSPIRSLYAGGSAAAFRVSLEQFLERKCPDFDDMKFGQLRMLVHERGYSVSVTGIEKPGQLKQHLYAESLAPPPTRRGVFSLAQSLGTFITIGPKTRAGTEQWESISAIVKDALAVANGLADVGIQQADSSGLDEVCRPVRFGGFVIVSAPKATPPKKGEDCHYKPWPIPPENQLAMICSVFMKLPLRASALISNVIELARKGRGARAIQTLDMVHSIPAVKLDTFRLDFLNALAGQDIKTATREDLEVTMEMIYRESARRTTTHLG